MNSIKYFFVRDTSTASEIKVGDLVFLGEHYPRRPVDMIAVGHIIGRTDKNEAVVYFHYQKESVRNILDMIDSVNLTIVNNGTLFLMDSVVDINQ